MIKLYAKTSEDGHKIPDELYGIFFEDINYGGDGGLYAELIANRSFEYCDRNGENDKRKMCWSTTGEAELEIGTANPLNATHKSYAIIKGGKGGIRNEGYGNEGFGTKAGEAFILSLYARAKEPTELKISIADESEIAKTSIAINGAEWTKYEMELTATAASEHAKLTLEREKGETELEFISLFPKDTFKGRRNGMRKDIAELIAALKPGFMRFPGGCIVEGRSYANMYRWKDTIGAVEERKTNFNRWQMEEYRNLGYNSDDYFQSYGIGFYEYFQFCEDIGAKPVPVINCGMTCQWHEGLLVGMDELDEYIEDARDLIEFANGDGSGKWSKIRVDMGHKAPFNLEYLAIGNEQWGEEYFERYAKFSEELKRTNPEIKLVSSAGWKNRGWEFDLAYKWLAEHKESAYSVDEHFYKEPEWFIENTERYDGYDRSLPKVLIGEYAAHTTGESMADRRNNQYAALAEAAFLTGVERNSDHVTMTCYAPLLARIGHNQWQPDLIWFNNTGVYGTPSYYMLKLMAKYAKGSYVETDCADESLKISASKDGNRLIIKAVNLSEEEKPIRISADEEYEIRSAEYISADKAAENSMAEPKRVYPTMEENLSGKEYTLRANSLTVIELKRK